MRGFGTTDSFDRPYKAAYMMSWMKWNRERPNSVCKTTVERPTKPQRWQIIFLERTNVVSSVVAQPGGTALAVESSPSYLSEAAQLQTGVPKQVEKANDAKTT